MAHRVSHVPTAPAPEATTTPATQATPAERRTSSPPRFSTLGALRHSDYRHLWLGQLGQSASLWIEMVARSWLVWELTGSATALGTVNLLRALPMLFFGMMAGVASDRMDKKRLLMLCQLFTMLNLLLLGVMIVTDTIQLWVVYSTAFLMGSSTAFLQPARTSLIPSLVPREELTNAVALNNAAMNVTRIAGPASAGILIGQIGVGGIYLTAAAFYLWTIWSVSRIGVRSETAAARKGSMWGNMKEGLAFCWQDKTILTLMALALIPMTFGMPYMTLMPVFADTVLDVGASGLGILLGASGVGALIGSLLVATYGGRLVKKGLPLTLGVMMFGVCLVGFAMSHWLPLSLGFIALASSASTGYLALTNASLLENSPPELHGRVMSVYMLDRGLMPLGTMFIGITADYAGAPIALTIMGGICLGLAALVAAFVPQVRRV